MKRSRKNSAFTLIELLIVISILAILLTSLIACSVGGYFIYQYATDDDTEQIDTEEATAEEATTE